MDQRDEEFQKKLMGTFRIEAREHLSAISAGLIELEKTPADKQPAVIETVFRESHSLKGAARSVNLPEVVSLCQSMENVFSALKRGAIRLVAGHIDILYEALDCVGRLVSGGAGEVSHKSETNEMIRRLEAVVSGGGAEEQRSGGAEGQRGGGAEERRGEGLEEELPPCPSAPPPLGHTMGETIRISMEKLDSLCLQAEELLAVKLATGQRATELREAKHLLELWKKESAKGKGGGAEGQRGRGAEGRRSRGEEEQRNAFSGVSLLEEKLTSLVKAAEYDTRSFGAKVDALLDNMKKALMLPFSSITGAFPRVVRDLARDSGKNADLTIDCGEIEIDRRILEEMKDPIMHLIRNCVDHGIETPDERKRKNKSRQGNVRITAASLDNKLEIVVSDDGAGFDLSKIKASAVKQGILSREEAERLETNDALLLSFHSGVTASPLITDISGRGLGLAIVREKVEKLNGSLSVDTRPDEGTTFRMVVPVSLSTFRGVLVRSGEQMYVLPSTNVERVVRVKQEEIKTVENRETLSLNGQTVSFSRLGDVLGVNGGAGERGTKGARGQGSGGAEGRDSVLQAVVLNSAEKHMAFLVDEVLQEQEVLVKSLGRQLSRVRNVAGATVLGSGKAVLILNVPDLMKSAVKVAAPRAIRPAPEARTKGKSILVAEDSITSRSLLKNILDSEGYDVTTAVDGMDALTALKSGRFDLVVSDVQMPRMDGFELVSRIRADKKLSELPVVLVTALETREDREQGIDVGANAYIVKSSFEQSNLLSVIEQLI